MEDIARINQQLYGLRLQCEETEQQLKALRMQVLEAERRLQELHNQQDQEASLLSEATRSVLVQSLDDLAPLHAAQRSRTTPYPLDKHDYPRYGRQLILPEIGASGQSALKHARVLIVGVGGLGCPAAAYLAGAGIGTIGLVDGDTVEESNLHRQIAHSTDRVGMSKVESAYIYLHGLNPMIRYEKHPEHLTPAHAVNLFKQYDLILDCTDHPTTRYMISDACVITGRTLISASALKTEGQLIVLNNPPLSPGDANGGPCYRCIFPKPPPADTVVTCGEGGILGPVVGTMGVLQALKAIKVLTVHTQKVQEHISGPPRTSMLLFSAYGPQQFRTIRMRGRRPDCASCSAVSSINEQTMLAGSVDYATFCGVRVLGTDVPNGHQVSAAALSGVINSPSTAIVDVRDAVQYEICSLQASVNIPWTGDTETWREAVKASGVIKVDTDIYFICRYGNDSRLALSALQDAPARTFDVRGGFNAWRKEVDPEWPEY